jgi:hypothetical protein
MMVQVWAGGDMAARGVRAWWASTMRRLRQGWQAATIRTARLTGAATLGYVLAQWLLSETRPLTAALTSLLIVQVTLVSTVTDTVRRIVSVVLGVVVAIVFASVFGFSVVSLAVLIAASLGLGLVLRLGPHLLEVPISAMLVLGVNGSHSAATDRIGETLVGAAAGVLVALLFPPTVRGRTAAAAVEEFAIELADLLEAVVHKVPQPVTAEQTQQWLEQARQLSSSTDQIDQILERAKESRRLNPRAAGRPDPGPGLRSGLATLEHCAVALRAFYRSLADRAAEGSDARYLFDRDTSDAFSVLLLELADALRRFGALVRAEAEADDEDVDQGRDPNPGAMLMAALDSVQEPRARLADLLAVDPRADPELWEQHGAMLAAVGRVLRELDAEEHARQRKRQERLVEETKGTVVSRLRTAAKHVAELPFRWND